MFADTVVPIIGIQQRYFDTSHFRQVFVSQKFTFKCSCYPSLRCDPFLLQHEKCIFHFTHCKQKPHDMVSQTLQFEKSFDLHIAFIIFNTVVHTQCDCIV